VEIASITTDIGSPGKNQRHGTSDHFWPHETGMLLKMETHGSIAFGGRNLRVDAGKHSKCSTFETNTADKTLRNHLVKSSVKSIYATATLYT